MQYVFLILHYKNADITEQCVDSLLKSLQFTKYEILIVDNASNNGSYEDLSIRYSNKKNIHFIRNEENIGYARGNNVGFLYAKNVLKADWICLANNDLVFGDTKWIIKSVEFYKRNPYYVMGPDIITLNGEHQNPFKETVAEKREIIKKIRHDKMVYILLKLGIQRKLRSVIKKQTNIWSTIDYKSTRVNFEGTLHGSCLIFSPEYVKRFDGLYDGTFLYAEEEILCYILKKLGCRYSYYCEMQVTHCHGTTFNRSENDEDKRKMIIVKNRILSYQKYLRIVSDNKNFEDYLVKKQ